MEWGNTPICGDQTMTVQSIDKRLAAEANMTPATSDKQQNAVSAEDAFVALLQQTNQRFGNKAAGNAAPDKVLAAHFNRKQDEVRTDKAQTARDDGSSDRAAAAKDPRPAAKADKPRPAQGNAPAAKTVAKDDAPAASAPAADDEAKTVAAADDDNASAAPQQDDNQGADQNQGKAEAQQVETAAVAVQQQVVVEIDIEITETVEVVEVGPATQAAQTDTAAQQALANANQAGKSTKDPQAGLGKDDRQRIEDLGDRIVDDLESGDVDDALDAAAELVTQLAGKAAQQQGEGVHGRAHAQDKTDAAKAQADDLAAKLAGTGAQLDIQVQVNRKAADAPVETAAIATETVVVIDPAAQGQQAASQGQNQGPQQNAQAAATTTAPQAAQATAAAEPMVEDIRAFSAVLAAQVESNAQETKAAPEQRSVAGLAGIGAAQAADKPGAAQASQAARAPRVPLQQQVMEQVSVQIDKAVKDGADTVKIQLKPMDLGRIEIKLEVVDGHVSATVTAEKPETLALLQKDSKGLEKALEDAGLKPEANGTSFSLRNGEQQQNADRGNNHSRRGRGRGHGDEVETAGSLAATQTAQPRRAGGRVGVDISV